jgi:amidophosphoribosyltransferase
MGGFFGVVSKCDCVSDLFFGTDYHSHLGTVRGGLAVGEGDGFARFIHDIRNAPFRSKFEHDVDRLKGRSGIGVISDLDDQPLIIRSHLGTYSLVTVGAIRNADALARGLFMNRGVHFAEMGGGGINPTELVAAIINEEDTFEDGIRRVQNSVDGSCSLLVLTRDALYAARDRRGRTPIVLGRREGAHAAAMESCAFANLGYETTHFLGPGEIVRMTADGVERVREPGDRLQICAFLWVYYGYPASSYEGINVELVRNRCGDALARRDDTPVDIVAGIPDSGTAHAIGYANARGLPHRRPFVKYTPTWPRSFMPQDQSTRDLVAGMKLLPIREFIDGQRLLFCEDSIVRGTQLRGIVERLLAAGAREVHMRPACPPLVFGCPFLNFSRSRSVMELAARAAIHEIEGGEPADLSPYVDSDGDAYARMVDIIRKNLKLTTLRYQRMDDMVGAIGLPKEKLCTGCWDGAGCAAAGGGAD